MQCGKAGQGLGVRLVGTSYLCLWGGGGGGGGVVQHNFYPSLDAIYVAVFNNQYTL